MVQFLNSLYHCSLLNLIFVMDPIFFPGLGLLNRVNVLREEAQHLEMEGLGKIEVAVGELEAEGLYRLLRGVISDSPMFSAPPPTKNCCHHL